MKVIKIVLVIIFVFMFYLSTSAQETDTTQFYNVEFRTTADQLTEDLKARLTLTDQQAEEIKNILIQYQENRQFGNVQFNTPEEDVTIDAPTESVIEPETEIDATETDIPSDTVTDTSITNDQRPGNYDANLDNNSNQSDDPQEKADMAIEKVLNETQKTTWSIISDAWWRDVNSRYQWDKRPLELE